MAASTDTFEDFHLHGASAPEWNQRYAQLSPGVMRSVLSEWADGGVGLFRKWMSERVVQQGGLPAGKVCVALLGGPTGAMRVQGREFGEHDLLILRGGDAFEFQRPAGTELLSVTFCAEVFMAHLDAIGQTGTFRWAQSQTVVRAQPGVLAALRGEIRSQLGDTGAAPSRAWMHTVSGALSRATGAPAQRAASRAAAQLVRTCHELCLSADAEAPLRIDDLCRQLGTSRRTLQNSFHDVTGLSPAAYLRNLRLNTVRRRLLARAPASVSDVALDAGFDHLGHFAGHYKALFGEAPSLTRRHAVRAG